jgi:hypothetical protein
MSTELEKLRKQHKATGLRRGPPKGVSKGRRDGSKNKLDVFGAVKAMAAANHRVPKDAAPGAERVAGRALERIVDVMEGKVKRYPGFVLHAATTLREEVCGKVASNVNIQADISWSEALAKADEIDVTPEKALSAPAGTALPENQENKEPVVVQAKGPVIRKKDKVPG